MNTFQFAQVSPGNQSANLPDIASMMLRANGFLYLACNVVASPAYLPAFHLRLACIDSKSA
jgi:hypothetical protein